MREIVCKRYGIALGRQTHEKVVADQRVLSVERMELRNPVFDLFQLRVRRHQKCRGQVILFFRQEVRCELRSRAWNFEQRGYSYVNPG